MKIWKCATGWIIGTYTLIYPLSRWIGLQKPLNIRSNLLNESKWYTDPWVEKYVLETSESKFLRKSDVVPTVLCCNKRVVQTTLSHWRRCIFAVFCLNKAHNHVASPKQLNLYCLYFGFGLLKLKPFYFYNYSFFTLQSCLCSPQKLPKQQQTIKFQTVLSQDESV